jgi:hypothetical protein
MNNIALSKAAKAVVRRNTEVVQGKGNFDAFEELLAEDFVDHSELSPSRPYRVTSQDWEEVLGHADG